MVAYEYFRSQQSYLPVYDKAGVGVAGEGSYVSAPRAKNEVSRSSFRLLKWQGKLKKAGLLVT